jgi:hypothetical protein
LRDLCCSFSFDILLKSFLFSLCIFFFSTFGIFILSTTSTTCDKLHNLNSTLEYLFSFYSGIFYAIFYFLLFFSDIYSRNLDDFLFGTGLRNVNLFLNRLQNSNILCFFYHRLCICFKKQRKNVLSRII